MATALYGELQLIREIFLDNRETLRNPPTGSGQSFFVPLPVVKFLPELAGRIGLLSSDTVKTVTAAYLVVEQTRRELLTLGRRHAEPSE